jgi:hypothetical protein
MKTLSRVAWAGTAGTLTARHGVARVRTRERHRQIVAPAAAGSVVPARGQQAFDIRCITSEFGLPHWNGEWRRLLLASRSPEKIYQSPEFFRYLSDAQTSASDRFELFVITDRASGQVVGMVPVRLSSIALDVKAGRFKLFACQPRIVRILGSVPLAPPDAALWHQLFAHLLHSFPACAAVSMQAFPRALYGDLGVDPRHVPFAVHGWRACHTLALPDNVPAWLAAMSAKKRYNIGRAWRLLEQATGPLQLQRIDRSVNVRELVAAVAALAPQGAHAGARDYRVLAANRLLLSYVLRSAGEVVAVVAGSRYGDTWHVHQILYAPKYRYLSAGTVALQAALQDVIAHFTFTTADFGFGTPRHPFPSHILHTRAHVLVARKGAWPARLLAAFMRVDALHAACARRVKPLALRLQRFLGR